ncbi:MAG: ABC transporter substrate-binding protein [Deltaproteobacteria bacterium]|nr:ABC transporter substrate-binding protein [Deltaproteobacteria bacterium]
MNCRSLVLLVLLSALMAFGCGKRIESSAQAAGMRAVSLSPAITDIMFDIGLGEKIVGVSKYCILPRGIRRAVVGNMMTVDTEALLSVKPTHVFFQGPRGRFRNLKRFNTKIRLESFKIETISDILRSARKIGEIAGRPGLAENTISSFQAKIAAVAAMVAGLGKRRVAFILGMGSYETMAAGPGTFIDDLITTAGGINVGRDLPGRQVWRKTNTESLLATKPEVLICQIDPSEKSGGERARQKWSRYIDQPQIGLKRVEIVSDRRWTFPSTRIAEIALPLAKILHPSLP